MSNNCLNNDLDKPLSPSAGRLECQTSDGGCSRCCSGGTRRCEKLKEGCLFVVIAVILAPLAEVAFVLWKLKMYRGFWLLVFVWLGLTALLTFIDRGEWLFGKAWGLQKWVLEWQLICKVNRFALVGFIVVSFIGYLSLTIGMILQEVLCILLLLGEPEERFLSYGPYVFPIFIGLQAVILHAFTCLVAEAIASPPFTRCRSRFAIATASIMFDEDNFTNFIDENQLKLVNTKGIQVAEGCWFSVCFPSHVVICALAWSFWSAKLTDGDEDFFFLCTSFHAGLFWGSTIWFFLTMALRLVSEVVIYFGWNTKERRQQTEKLRKVFQFFIEQHRFGPGHFAQEDESWKAFAAAMHQTEQAGWWLKKKMDELKESLKADSYKPTLFDIFYEYCFPSKDSYHCCSYHCCHKVTLKIVATVAPCFLWTLSFYSLKLKFESVRPWAILFLLLSMYLVNVVTTMWLPFLMGKKRKSESWFRPRMTFFQLYLILFAILMLSLPAGVFLSISDTTPLEPMMNVNESHVNGSEVTSSFDPYWVNNLSSTLTNVSKYPVCSMNWAGGTLDILDIAALSYYSYAKNKSEYENLIQTSFGYKIPVQIDLEDYYIAQNRGLPRVVATIFENATILGNIGSARTIVVAVKGTDTFYDVILDLALYAAVAVYQVSGFIVPVMDILPNGLIAKFFGWYRLPLFRKLQRNIVKHVTKKVHQLKDKYPQANFVMTGHSLGGGIAQIVGSQLAIDTVVFSAPGSHFTRNTTGVGLERQYRSVVDIVPDSDMVPRVDRHDTQVQNIGCWKKNSLQDQPVYERSAGQCHKMLRTACELWRVCGDPRNRSYLACKEYVDPGNWGVVYTPRGDSQI